MYEFVLTCTICDCGTLSHFVNCALSLFSDSVSMMAVTGRLTTSLLILLAGTPAADQSTNWGTIISRKKKHQISYS